MPNPSGSGGLKARVLAWSAEGCPRPLGLSRLTCRMQIE